MENKNWTVYMHIVPNGKKYIGITSRDVHKRWKNGSGYYNHKYFYNAIKKYSWHNIEHKVLYTNLTEIEAKNMEKQLILEYKTSDRKYGYNLTLGGDGRCGKCFFTNEEKQKHSLANRGKNTHLTENDVFNIKQDLLNGKNYEYIYTNYNVKKDSLSVIVTGKNWGYVMPEFTFKYYAMLKEAEQLLVDNIKKYCLCGLTIEQIANKCNCSCSVVTNRMKKHNIHTVISKNNNNIKNLKSIIQKEFLDGKTKKEIMATYNISSKQFNNYTQGIHTALKLEKDKKIMKEMCLLRKAGITVSEIAKMYNCNREKVTLLTKEFMWQLKKEDIKKCYELSDNGIKNREIAKIINRDIDFVENWLNKRKEDFKID